MKEFNTMENAKHYREDVKEVVDSFHKKVSANRRYASYDFCYGYFQTHRHHLVENMELSCLHLWAYLASWGMLRGSSLLLKECSMKVLSNVITYLDGLPESIWSIDVPKYKNKGVKRNISNIYNELQKKIRDIKFEDMNKHVSATTTLVTKIMLGTLGCVPALDQNFVIAFKKEFDESGCNFSELNEDVLNCIYDFYNDNRDLLHPALYRVIGFNGKPTMKLQYKFAKLIDMYGFNIGSIIQGQKKINKISK